MDGTVRGQLLPGEVEAEPVSAAVVAHAANLPSNLPSSTPSNIPAAAVAHGMLPMGTAKAGPAPRSRPTARIKLTMAPSLRRAVERRSTSGQDRPTASQDRRARTKRAVSSGRQAVREEPGEVLTGDVQRKMRELAKQNQGAYSNGCWSD